MKIALISTSFNTGGAAVVTTRLARALMDLGHEVRMLTFVHEPDAPEFVECISGPSDRLIRFLPERLMIFANNGFDRTSLFKVSIANTGMPLHRHAWVRQADAIVLGWINQGMLSLDGIRRLGQLGKPLVWVMHDPWCMTGACHHPYECTRYRQQCGNCPMMHSGKSANDLSHKTWLLKKALYDSTPVQFVAVSNWLKGKCDESSLLAGRNVTVIPNAFPADAYRTKPDQTPDIDGVDSSKRLILMGAARLDDPIKGLDYAIDALNMIAERDPGTASECQAVLFGGLRDSTILKRLKFPYVHTGPITDPAAVASLYMAGKVVISASMYETLPTTLIEGQAAGCLPVSFGQGGQSDIITHRVNGYIAEYRNTADMANGILWALQSDISREKLHRSVVDRFGARTVAQRYVALIDSLLEKMTAEKL